MYFSFEGWLLWLFFSSFYLISDHTSLLAILQLKPLLGTVGQLLLHPLGSSGSTWKAPSPKAPAGTAVPKDTQVNVAIYWGSAGAASCLQLGNPAFCCSWAGAGKYKPPAKAVLRSV